MHSCCATKVDIHVPLPQVVAPIGCPSYLLGPHFRVPKWDSLLGWVSRRFGWAMFGVSLGSVRRLVLGLVLDLGWGLGFFPL